MTGAPMAGLLAGPKPFTGLLETKPFIMAWRSQSNRTYGQDVAITKKKRETGL